MFAHVVVIVTSASGFDVARIAVRVLVGEIEVVATVLTLPFSVHSSSISLVQKFWREDPLVSTEELPSRLLTIHGSINAGFITRSIVLRVLSSEFVKVVMLNSLSGSYSLIWIHIEHFLHQFDFNVVHNRCISCFQGFWMINFGKLKTLVSRVSIELFLQEVGQFS